MYCVLQIQLAIQRQHTLKVGSQVIEKKTHKHTKSIYFLYTTQNNL